MPSSRSRLADLLQRALRRLVRADRPAADQIVIRLAPPEHGRTGAGHRGMMPGAALARVPQRRR